MMDTALCFSIAFGIFSNGLAAVIETQKIHVIATQKTVVIEVRETWCSAVNETQKTVVTEVIEIQQPAVIQTQPNVVAAVGDKVSLKCWLIETKDVQKVIWQKVLPNGKTNVASRYKRHGQIVNPVFKDKVEFEDAGLQNSSIPKSSPNGKTNIANHNKHHGQIVIPVFKDKVESGDAGLQNSSIFINNVTEQDEGCYDCLFDPYPGRALTGRTCLQVYELHPPVLHVRRSNSPDEFVVTCSATGRPAPNVTLRATPQDHNLTHYYNVSVSNTNCTVTVTATAVLSALHLNSTQVVCTAGVLAGPHLEVMETCREIPGFKPTSAGGFIWTIVWFVLFVVGCCCVAAFCIVVYRKRRKKNRPEAPVHYDAGQCGRKKDEENKPNPSPSTENDQHPEKHGQREDTPSKAQD